MGAPQYEQAGADIGGTGTTNTIPRWTGPSTLGDSQLKDNGTLVGIGASLTSGNRLVIGGVASGTSFIKANEATFQIGNIFAGPVQILTSDTPQVTVTATGNVGIGTPSPGYRLHVKDATNRNMIMTSGTTGMKVTSLTDAGAEADIGVQGNTVQFLTGGTERARIDSAGRLLQGTSAAPASAEIALVTARAGNSGGQEWVHSGTGGCAIVPISGGGGIAYTFANAVGSESYGEVFRWNAAGNLVLNSANVGCTIQAAGTSQGLKLQGTAGTNNTDPNVLDFYADGGTANSGGVTWTPALRFGGATTGITGSQVGRYTRIGNMVFAQGTIALSSKGSATGAASIAGLPTSANVAATIYYSIAIGYNSKVTFTGQLHGLISVNSGIVELYQTSTAGVVSAITNTDFAADSVLTFTVCYPVT